MGLALVAAAASRRPHRGGRRPWLALAALAPVLLVLALADPQLRSGTRRPTVLAIDRSASIGARARAIEGEWLAHAGEDDCVSPCRIVAFAGTARAGAPDLAGSDAPARAGTDIAAGVELAAGLAPPGGRVVVLSDGAQTGGDLAAAAAAATARRVEVDWARLPAARERDAAVTAISVPGAVRRGDAVPLTLTVDATVAGRAVLLVRSDGGPPRSETVRLHAGENPLLLLYAAARQGWHSFEATVSLPGDAVPGNDSLAAVTDVLAAPRVLVVAAPGSRLPGMLARDGLEVSETAPGRLPLAAAGYSGYAAVALDDVAAPQLSATRIQALDAAVRVDGLGLLALGGPDSFSLGRYATSGLQRLLPVASLVPGNLQRRNVAIELVLDHSGSMIDPSGGAPKIVMTHVATTDTAAFITAHQDELGVIDFDVAPHTLVPLQRLVSTAAERRVDATVDGLQADGGTNIYAGLAAGLDAILRSDAPQRHIVLMTDGISQPQNYAPLLARLRRARISVATVALGSDADRALLARIARASGGHAYVTDDAKALPRIFAKEAELSAKPVRVEGRLAVSLGADSPVVRSLAGAALPALRGNVVTTLKSGAQADLVASNGGGRSDPALAEWQVGLGRVVTWTPGLGAPWASAWTAAGSLWNDAVRWLDRAATPPPLAPRTAPGTPGALALDLAPSGAAALLVNGVDGTLTDAAGRSTRIAFAAVGPDRFQADVASLAPGVYRFALATDGPGTAERAAGEVAIPYPPELSPAPVAPAALGQLVAQTGGVTVRGDRVHALAVTTTSLRRLLALLALLAFLAGVAWRMLPGLGRRRRRAVPAAAAARVRARRSSSERALSSSSSSGSTEVDGGT